VNVFAKENQAVRCWPQFFALTHVPSSLLGELIGIDQQRLQDDNYRAEVLTMRFCRNFYLRRFEV
jgi:hypothetical protein